MRLNNSENTFIIIVSYNGMSWISKCLESTRPYPVIVVDNLSTDGTADYIEANHPDVILLRQKTNLGFGKANNLGISFALKKKANFVFLLNQDAYLEQNTLATLIRVSLRNPDYGIISPIHLNAKGDNLEDIFHYYITRESPNKLFTDFLLKKQLKDLYEVEMINAAAWLLPKKTLKIVGGFSPIFFLYGEDDNYCQRVRFHNLKIGICPGVYIKHDSGKTYHIDLRTGTEEYYKKFLNQVKVIGADVNEGKENFKQLQKFQKQEIFKGFLKFRFRKVLIDFQKWQMIKDLDFSPEIEEERKKNSHYLDI